MLTELTGPLLTVLCAGVISGICCKQWGVSLVIGYLLAGACIGIGGLNLVNVHQKEMEILAEVGALFFLLSIGIEFSLNEMLTRGWDFLKSGMLQMGLVIVPLAVMLSTQNHLPWNVSILLSCSVALSSTVIVFRSLAEMGQLETPHSKRALGILLFQDISLVPLLLFIPLLTGEKDNFSVMTLVLLTSKTTVFLLTMALLYQLLHSRLFPLLSVLRSVELILLVVLCLMGGICWWAVYLGLPATIGALATGLVLSGNRLSHQIDSILLPFRETFAAVFFVSLGMLLEPGLMLKEPILIIGGMGSLILLKTLSAGIALTSVGMSWRTALAMGLGISQLGEFTFMLAAKGLEQHVISQEVYNKILLMALGSLMLTPMLLRFGLTIIKSSAMETESHKDSHTHSENQIPRTLVVGMGPIGRQVASRLETLGVEVSLVDLSPVNLQKFAQAGFHTISGDACDPKILSYAGGQFCHLAVISVPEDNSAVEVVKTLRKMNSKTRIIARCHFQSNIILLKHAGANQVTCEEVEVSTSILKWCDKFVLDTVK